MNKTSKRQRNESGTGLHKIVWNGEHEKLLSNVAQNTDTFS